MLPNGFWLLDELLLLAEVLFVVVLFDVEVDYFSLSAFLMTACMDSPSVSDKVESSVSSFRILPESLNHVPLWMSLMLASGD